MSREQGESIKKIIQGAGEKGQISKGAGSWSKGSLTGSHYHKVLFTELSCDGMSDMLAVYRPSIGDHCFTFLNQIESFHELS